MSSPPDPHRGTKAASIHQQPSHLAAASDVSREEFIDEPSGRTRGAPNPRMETPPTAPRPKGPLSGTGSNCTELSTESVVGGRHHFGAARGCRLDVTEGTGELWLVESHGA